MFIVYMKLTFPWVFWIFAYKLTISPAGGGRGRQNGEREGWEAGQALHLALGLGSQQGHVVRKPEGSDIFRDPSYGNATERSGCGLSRARVAGEQGCRTPCVVCNSGIQRGIPKAEG